MNRTAFFRGTCFDNPRKEPALSGGTDGPEESHGTRSLKDENERLLRGVDNVLEVTVDKETDGSDAME